MPQELKYQQKFLKQFLNRFECGFRGRLQNYKLLCLQSKEKL